MNKITHPRGLCQNPAQHHIPTFSRDINKKPYSGFIIIKLSERFSYFEENDLHGLMKKYQLTGLMTLIEKTKPDFIRRNVQGVPVKQLMELEKKAQNSEFPPLRSLSNYWRLDYRNYEGSLEELAKVISDLHGVDFAYQELSVTDPFINAGDDTFAAQQGYLNAAPTGIDARWAWTQIDRPGEGVGFIDLEQGWIPTHEDIAGTSPTLLFNDNRDGVGSYIGDHGTAVLGQVVGIDNGRGVVGIAPFVDYVRMVSHFEAGTGTALHVADAIVAAIINMNAGDVLLLEVQRNLLPTEVDAADFDAIRLAVANGIIVVEAAGNGNNNLDSWTNGGGLTILNRRSTNFTDSGAIMVGASLSPLPHNRAGFSNFGSRIDCFAWGENIVTCGYAARSGGSLGNDGTTTMNDDYTSTFSGTSGASPIIVGAALIIQGLYRDTTSTILSPTQMRALLTDPATGTVQGGGVTGNIGIMPDLRAIIEDTLDLVPDVYLRDFVGDTGTVPSAGAISASPDIIVRPNLVADAIAEFGEGSGNENSNTLGNRLEAGQDNYIYVRIKNRGGSNASNVTAAIYWSEVATLITPDMWHFIGNTDPIDVPVGNVMAVSPPLTWNSASLPPADTHQCFVGILQHAQDPAPPIPGPTNFDWNDFTAFIKNNNNVTWRNFNVVNDIDPRDPNTILHFNITGAPDKDRAFDFQILNQLPRETKIWFEMPYNLFVTARIRGMETRYDQKKNAVFILIPNLRKINFCEVTLPKSAKYACSIIVQGGRGFENGMHQIAIRQIFENFEVGRVTWGLQAKL